jgi:hypothetical protein
MLWCRPRRCGPVVAVTVAFFLFPPFSSHKSAPRGEGRERARQGDGHENRPGSTHDERMSQMFILPEIWRQRSATCKTTFIYDANDAEDADVANSASGDGDMPTVSRGGEPNCWGTG